MLARVWAEAGLGELLGLAAASDGETGCAVAVTGEPLDPDSAQLRAAAGQMAAELGLAGLQLVTVHGSTLRAVVRDWLYQAAQGSGRGVTVALPQRSDGVLEVVVTSWDSSAREVVLRLDSRGGAHAPESVALALALGRRAVVVSVGRDTVGEPWISPSS